MLLGLAYAHADIKPPVCYILSVTVVVETDGIISFTDLNVKHEPHNGEGMLWIYGDSVSKRFAEFLVNGPYHKICEDMFKQCKVTYSWVYNVKNAENKAENIEGKDYDHERVIGEINKVKRIGLYSGLQLCFTYSCCFT